MTQQDSPSKFVDAALLAAIGAAALYVAGFMFTSGVLVGMGVGRFGIDLSSERTVLRGVGPSLVALLTLVGPLMAHGQEPTRVRALLWDFPLYVALAAVVTAAVVAPLPILLRGALGVSAFATAACTARQTIRRTSVLETFWVGATPAKIRALAVFIVLVLVLSLALGVVNGAHANQASVALVAEGIVTEENATLHFALRDNGYMYFVQDPAESAARTILVVPESSVKSFVVTPPRDEWLVWLFL